MKNVKLPDYFTYLNAACGLISIVFSINLMFGYAVIFMLISAVLDFVDGRTARLINRKGNFGKELDSLADIVSFGIAPIIFGVLYLEVNAISIIIYILFLTAGLTRLAKYNITRFKGYFTGMPITMNAIIIPICYFILPKEYLIFVYFISALLMVSPFKIKKLQNEKI